MLVDLKKNSTFAIEIGEKSDINDALACYFALTEEA